MERPRRGPSLDLDFSTVALEDLTPRQVAPTQRTFDDLGQPLHAVTFCVVDLETTGGAPGRDGITEVGAVKVRGGEVVGTFQTLVDPGVAIPPTITLLTGITHAMVHDAPTIHSVLPSFLEFVGDSVIVAHNAGFDMGFLRAAASSLGYAWPDNRVLDTVSLARRVLGGEVRNHRLATLARHFRAATQPCHRALDDAKATVDVLHGLLERCGSLGVTALEDLLILPTAKGSPHYEKIGLARSLPRRPGVYLFKDRHGTVVYVGKATNLRTRVSSYFYGDTRRRVTDILREVDAIDHLVTAGDLEATVTELRLIHELRPRHNRRSKPPRSTHWVTLVNERHPRLSVTRTIHVDAHATLGPFRSKRTAELVLTALWDASPIRRCRGSGERTAPCAPAQLGVAACPCDGSIDPSIYRAIVRSVARGMAIDPTPLLDELTSRMHELSAERRYEEAGWMRDRHDALARAVARAQRWRALAGAGRVELRLPGESVVIEHGQAIAFWPTNTDRPLVPSRVSPGVIPPVAPSVAAAEECDLIWSWIDRNDVAIVDADAPLSLPTATPWPLAVARRRAVA